MEAGIARVDGASTSAPAGWYTNPEGPGVRYWSGTHWGEIRPETASSCGSAKALEGQSQAWWAAVVAAAAMIIGGFGPWATALGFVSVNGTHGDGWLVIAAGGAALVGLCRYAKNRGDGALKFSAAAGGVGAAVAVYTFVRLESAQGEFFGERVDIVDPAWGLYASILGGAALTIMALRLRRERTAGTAK